MELRQHLKLSAVTAFLMAAGAAHANPIIGSLPLNGGGLTQNGSDLSVSTMIMSGLLTTLSLGAGDYAFIPIGTNFGPATLNYTSSTTLSSFSFTSAVWGSFVASANPSNEIIDKTAGFLDVFITGTFTPGSNAGWAGKDPTPASVRFSVNQSGSSLSEAITLSSPPAVPQQLAVPEPATMALIGTALIGLALLTRRYPLR
jgi:hypothetical protein